MKCVVCHGEDVKEASVVEEIPVGPDIVIVDVETLVCGACGERYYDRPTMQRLEQGTLDSKP